jgi:hypothetical protein
VGNQLNSLAESIFAKIVNAVPVDLHQGAIMNGTILVYGNEPTLVRTRGLILEKTGYKVLTSTAFANAMLTLVTQQVDVLLLCPSLTDEERRGIWETALALQPEIKCVVLDFAESEETIEGVDLIRGLAGPSALLNAVGRMLTQKAATHTT